MFYNTLYIDIEKTQVIDTTFRINVRKLLDAPFNDKIIKINTKF